MSLPHTNPIDVSQVSPGNSDNELFAYMIESWDNGAYLGDFISNLDDYLPEFVFSTATLKKHRELYASGKTQVSPEQRARELLQKTTRENIHSSGELGEFLLFLFAQYVKNAHKLVSKIQSRGSQRTTLPGRDGIFLWVDESENVYLLSGEAKVRPRSNDGLRDAQSDMNSFWEGTDIKHEIRLASNHIRDELTPDTYPFYEMYFVDDSAEHANLRYKNVIFVGYSCSAFQSLINGASTMDEFKKGVVDELTRCFQNQTDLIAESTCASIYCFVPFESVEEARETFADHNDLIIE